MRRREKFVIAAFFLSLCLLVVQYISLEWRYLSVGVFVCFTYLVSNWVLSDDLQSHERITIVPFSALYAGAVGLFYFLLPSHFFSRILILVMFGIGMYALFLTSNIYSVAKGRTIQLLHAAHAIGLLFTLLTSLLFANSLFSLKLPFYWNAVGTAVTHFPLIMMSLWSVKLESKIKREVWSLTTLLTVVLVEVTILLSLMPQTVWYQALFVMSFLYLGISVLRSYLDERLFRSAVTEYSLVAVFVLLLYILVFPTK